MLYSLFCTLYSLFSLLQHTVSLISAGRYAQQKKTGFFPSGNRFLFHPETGFFFGPLRYRSIRNGSCSYIQFRVRGVLINKTSAGRDLGSHEELCHIGR